MERTVLRVAGSDGADATDAASLDGVVATVRTVDPDDVDGADPSTADCAVVGPGLDRERSLDAVGRLADAAPGLPVLASSSTADGRLAAEATRRGADGYHVADGDGPSLADRVADLLDGRRPGERPPATADGGVDGGTETGVGAGDGGAEARSADDGAGTQSSAGGEAIGPGRTERALDEFSARSALEAIARGSPDGIVLMDADSRIRFVNRGFESLTGYDRETLLGSSYERVVPDRLEEDHRAAVEAFERSDDETTWDYVEAPILTGDGEERFVGASFGGFEEDGETFFAGIVRDIEQRRAREAELERYEDVIEAVDDGVYALDDDGRFALVNEAMTELTGYGREELLGEHTRVIKDPETVQLAEQALRDMVYGEDAEASFDLTLRPRDGDPFPSEDHMVVLTDDDGEFTGTAGVIRDIAEREERDRRLSELLETSRSLMRARSREEVAEIVVGATADTLGFEVNLVRLYDDESGALRAVASTDRSDEILGDRPVHEVGEGGPGTAFAEGAVKHYPREIDGADVPGGPIEEALYVPLGEFGVLSIGTTEAGAFTESDRSMAEILASSATVALGRTAREEELVRYRTVMENVQDMVYVLDGSGRFSLVTEPLADWLGYERAELAGMDPSEVLLDGEPGRFESAIGDVRRGDEASRTLETELVTAAGDRLPAAVEVSLLPAGEASGGSVGVVRDRSELLQTRQLLENERDRFSYLFDNLQDPVVEVAFDGDRPVVETVNDAFTGTFGYDAETVRGESLNDYVLSPDRREEGRRLDALAASGETVQREIRRETGEGYRDFLFRGIPYETADGRMHGFGIYTDITEQKERERRLEVLNRVLRHNLRNDLNVITGYAEIIEEEAADETLAERATTLREKAKEVSSLSERARTIERTIGRDAPRDDGVSVATVVRDAVEDCRDAHPEMRLETGVGDASVLGDGRLALAVSELLENVAEHAGDAPRAVVETDRRDGAVAVRVLDDGPGLPETERAIVGESAEITQLQHGSGLGLWIAKWLCESCGGRLQFEESRLGGSAVTLVLGVPDGE